MFKSRGSVLYFYALHDINTTKFPGDHEILVKMIKRKNAGGGWWGKS